MSQKFEEVKRVLGEKKKVVLTAIVSLLAIIAIAIGLIVSQTGNVRKSKKKVYDPELARAMSYEEFNPGDENIEGTDNVKFGAFFLRDLDGDGYAEKLKGTCKEIGKEDTLYMELNVQAAGVLKNAKIEINGQNFYLQTALPKDAELKQNYVGNNIRQIDFNDINSGTQKLLTGIVRSGNYSSASSKASAIGNNINNYSRDDNKIIFTGTYVAEDGTETEIRKEVELATDWYGSVSASVSAGNQTSEDLENRVDEENESLNLTVDITTKETNNQLNISKNYVEGTIPQLNGYDAIGVNLVTSNADFTYDETTKVFTITRTAEVNETGNLTKKISNSNQYSIEIIYPIEAYRTMDADTVTIKIPVKTYYEGYNNANEEFKNPYKSSEAKTTVVRNFSRPKGTVANFYISVGKYMSSPDYRYVVSKEKPIKIYNGISSEEVDDTFVVSWRAFTGSDGESTGIVMKETADGEARVSDQFIKTDSTEESMENITTNVGVYFSGANNFLWDDGWIKIYDDETDNVIAVFTKEDWGKYTSSNPYKYEVPVKHIRVETSSTRKSSTLYAYNIKELDDEYITTNYTREEFDSLEHIKSELVGYLGGRRIKTAMHQAKYEAPYSIATISISNNTISTQSMAKSERITINVTKEPNQNQVGWIDGSFLVKLPDEIITTEIRRVSISNSNVEITSYELIENESGKFIKINTKNKTEEKQAYSITIELNLAPDPRIKTTNTQIELYAANGESVDYYAKDVDKYDVNDNLNTEELIGKGSASISFIAPSSLLTNETISNFDEAGTLIISPGIAEIEPLYDEADNKEKEVTIGLELKNNYSSTVSDIAILGKIPFEGNTYVISGEDLGSNNTLKMKNTGIIVPEELQDAVVVYYSENENPTKDLSDEANGWKLSDEITNWDNVRTFLIDFKDTIIEKGDEYAFSYVLLIPRDLGFNKLAYSHHGVFFNLDTEEGKYKTQVEPSKIGICVVKQYSLEVTKYQKGKEKLIPGATYKITEIGEDGSQGEARTATTDANGKLRFDKLYAEKMYAIEEIKTPNDYELNSDVVKFVGHIDTDGVLTIEKLAGTIKGEPEVIKNEGEPYKGNINVEDETKGTLKIVKQEQGTGNLLKGIHYTITGEGIPASGSALTTDANGEATIGGLKINKEYTILETRAKGYYLASPIKFKIVNNDGVYGTEILNGTVKTSEISEENEMPIANLTIEDEKIPTYNLEITKIKKRMEVTEAGGSQEPEEITYLSGAKFRLYKEGKEIGEYVTDENGKLTIENLFQYVDGKKLDQTYMLKEIIAPDGYVRLKNITFKVQESNGKLKFIAEDGKEREFTSEGNTLKLTLEDSPSFKLVKRDGETGELLANIKFAIYNVDNKEVPATNNKGEIIGTKELINGKELFTVSTDANGELTLDLPEGEYKAVEVQAPDKYDIRKSVYYFGIGGSNEEKALIEEWAQGIGGTGAETIRAGMATSDGGYIVAGHASSSTIQLGDIKLTNNGGNDGLIIKYDSEGNVEWAQGIGGSGEEQLNSIAETSDGGYIVGGYFKSGSIKIGDTTLTNHGGMDGMVIKYDSEGNVEWAEGIGAGNDDTIDAVAETKDGKYIVGGYFYSESITIGDVTLINNGGQDGILIKYDSKGNAEWVQGIGTSGDDIIDDVAGTSDGGFVTGGYFQNNNIEIGDITLTNHGGLDGMIIKYDSEGNVEWAREVGESGHEYITAIAETSDGGYIAGGHFSSRTILLGDIKLTNNGAYDGLIIKYDSEGNVEWAEDIGGSDHDYIENIAETSDGGCLVGGRFKSQSIKIKDIVLEVNGGYDGMIIKYDSSGNAKWAKAIGSTSDDAIRSVAEIKNGKYIIGGYFSRTFAMGGAELVNKGSWDTMVICFRETELSEVLGREKVATEGNVSSIAETSDGGYIIGGIFESPTIQIGDITLTNASTNGSCDGMIIKYDSEGNVEWAKGIRGTNTEYIRSVAETSDGGYIVGGNFTSDSIQIGDITLTNVNTNASYDGMVIKYDSEGNVEWAKELGGTNEELIFSVAGTSDGGCIAGGFFYSPTIQIGDITLTNANTDGSPDGMVIKYDSEGNVEWAREIGGTNSDHIFSVAETSDGGCIAGGYFCSPTIQIGDITLTNNWTPGGPPNGIIIKYDAEGNVDWTERIGGKMGATVVTGAAYMYSVAVTSDGGYIVGGNFCGTIQIGELTLISNGTSDESHIGSYDGMIIKYDSEGNVEWARKTDGTGNDEIWTVAGTSDGGCIVGERFYSENIIIGDITLKNNGSPDGLIIKYDAEGNVEWAQGIGGRSYEYIGSVAGTSNGGCIVGGYFSSAFIKIGDIILKDNGSGQNAIVIKYDSKGNVVWPRKTEEDTSLPPKIIVDKAQVIGGTSYDSITSVAKTSDGGYIVGENFGSPNIQIGDITLTNNGGSDGLIIKYDGEDNVEWVQQINAESGTMMINSVAETSDGGCIVGGYISGRGKFEIGDITITNNSPKNIGCPDGVVIKYNNDGNVEWVRQISGTGGNEEEHIRSVAGTSDGGCIAVGFFWSDSIQIGDIALTNAGTNHYDGMVIKYGKDGNVEWAKSVEASDGSVHIHSAVETSDGGCIVGGQFDGTIQIGDIILTNNGSYDGLIIKYDSKGNVEWAKAIGGNSSENVPSVAETSDGGFIVGGSFSSPTIKVGDITLTSNGSSDGLIIKYDSEGNVEWAQGIGADKSERISSVAETSDGGYIATGEFNSPTIQIGDITLANNGSSDGMVIKYDSEGKVEWAEGIGADKSESFNLVAETNDREYLVGGNFYSQTIQIGDTILNNNSTSSSNGMILKLSAKFAAPEKQLLEVENVRKKFKITTDIEEIDGIKGGIISGEDENSYETVKYGDSSGRKIKMIPDENYEIIGIKVNGKDYSFEKAEDGSYTMPSFTDVREDKHVVVKYALKDNKIIINKVDTDTREPLAGAKFKLEQTDSGEVASELYYVEVETNSDGQAITQLPFGKYKITETQAPEGYILNEEPTIIDFIADENHEFTIENEKEAKVVIHHYIKGTTTKVAEDELKAGKVGEKYSTIPKLELDDYELEKDENGEFIIPENATGNFTSGEIEVTYYYVEKNIPLIVHHYLEGTEMPVTLADGSAAEDEAYSDKEGENYTTKAISDDELDSRYELAKVPENSEGIYQGKEIIVTYYYKEIERKVTLNKYQEDGETPLEDAKFTIEEVDSSSDVDENVDTESENAEDSKVQMEFTTDSKGRIQTILNAGEYVVTEVEAPEGYQLPENPSQNITVSKASADIVINLNNDKKQGKVIVHHYVEGTTTPLPLIDGTSAEDEIKTGLVGDIYATKQLVGYELVQVPENASGEYIDGDIEVIYYYKAIPAQVVVHHYIENTTTSLSPDVVIDGVLWQNYTTTVGEDVPEYYELMAEPENKAGIMTKEPIEVIYYYKLKMYSYVVNYLEKDNEENILIPQKQGDALEYGSEVIAEDEVIEIDGYDFDSVDKDTLTIGTEENVINIYYTLKDTSVLVHHYIEGTTTSLSDDVVIEGKVFETYETEVATDIPSKYELVAVPENAQGEMTEEQIVVTYYYRTKPTQVIVHHYEEGTTNKLSETVTIDGRIDDEYTTTAATDIPVKYELVAEPENASGIMTEEDIEVTYYYRVKDASLVIKYIEKNTNLEIAQSESQTGKVDEDYITGPKTIENYTLVGDSENTTGKLTVEPITVIFYYLQNTKVTVQYIDKATDEILEEVTEPGLVGDSYTATSKDFENYVLVERPAKETVTMGKEEIVLKYYYAKVSGGVIEKHIDVVTGDILANEVHTGNEGDSYDIPSKILEGYDLAEDKLPANAKGTMKVDTIEVTYYYHYRSRVVAEYVDKATGEKLVLDEVFDGHEGDDYTTEGKQIDDYRLIEVPENANGTMTKAPIKVTYYYVHLTGGVIERHIDIMTGEQLVAEEKFDGYEGDIYKTEPENIPYYDLVEEKYPANAEGTMTVEQIIVNYYYVRQTEVNVKYVDKVTGKEIEKTEVISGHEGDNYTTESKDITGFDLIEIPENKDGKMTKEAIEVTYYYARPAKVVVNHIDIETNQNLAEEEVITGHQDDTYVTESQKVKYYTMCDVPNNAKGKMIVNVVTEAVNDTTYVNYYYRKMEFNLKVDKTIGSVIVNGVEKQVNGNLGKVEIYRKELATTKVQVVYNIVVTNNSELSGKAKLLENIPDGMTMKLEKNTLWEISQTVAELETEDLKPGESKTYKVVLDWAGGENNTGTKKNMVQITGTENEAGYEEKDKQDNTDTADLIVTVGTGEYTYVAGVGITIIALAAIAVTVVARKKKE